MARIQRRDFLRLSALTAGALASGTLLNACQPKPSAGDPEQRPSETAQAAAEKPSVQPVSTQAAPQKSEAEAAEGVMGSGRGIFPGRVVWAHNPAATLWDGKKGFWWEAQNTDQALVNAMLSQTLQQLTGQKDDAAAWAALFESFNGRRGKAGSYRSGEKIAIKVNLNGCTEHALAKNTCFSSPHVTLALLQQLLAIGVNPADIVVYDAVRCMPDAIYQVCRTVGGVRFADFTGGEGRELCERDMNSAIQWSADLQGSPTYLPTCLTEAAYLINMASLKGHSLAGVTLTAKNHFGSILADLNGKPSMNAPQGANLHGFVAAHDFDAGPGWQWPQRPMKTYTPLVDLIGHPHLGEKTLLYLLDALYGVEEQNTEVSNKSRFQAAPFSDHWPSSLFLSQDGVAIDSVGADFLHNEPIIVRKANVMPANSTYQNYLHEAALADQPPSGSQYKLPSLGVHDHWNTPQERQYGRNLGKAEGVELITIA